MTLGIKVGPQKTSIQDLIDTDAPFAEVWYRPDRTSDYDGLFAFAKKRGTSLGLHHWAVTREGYWPTLAYPGDPVSDETEAAIRLTIDHAARIGAVYVNIHPGARTKTPFDFSTKSFGEPTDLQPEADAYPAIADALGRLTAYARSGGVTLTVETVPPYSSLHNAGYGKGGGVARLADVSVTAVADMVPDLHIANDFCHTAAEYIDGADGARAYLFRTTERLAARTRLLHVGFNIPPFDGTDFHDSLTNPVFSTATAVPDRDDTVRLLSLFVNRPDVYALVEPATDHVGNYSVLVTLAGASQRAQFT